MRDPRVVIFRRRFPKARALRRACKRLHSYYVFLPMKDVPKLEADVRHAVAHIPMALRYRVSYVPHGTRRPRREVEAFIRSHPRFQSPPAPFTRTYGACP